MYETKDEKDKLDKYLNLLLKEAKKSSLIDVPIAALIELDNKIISIANNQIENKNDSTNHAEILAIKKACKKVKNSRLINSTIYISLEPCLMCFGAIILSKIKRVVIYAKSEKTGVFSSGILDLNKYREGEYNFNSKPEVLFCENEEASKILKDFFKEKR